MIFKKIKEGMTSLKEYQIINMNSQPAPLNNKKLGILDNENYNYRSSKGLINWINSKLEKLKREFVNWKREVEPITKCRTEKYSVRNKEDSMD